MKLKTLASAILVCSCSTSLQAANSLPVGSNLGYGEASNKNTIFSSMANPAWISSSIHQENNYGFGITGGFKFQQKGFDTLNNDYKNNVAPLLENFDSNTQSAIVQAGKVEEELNKLVLSIRDNFYFQGDAGGSVPIVITNNEYGGFGLEFFGQVSGYGRILSSNRPVTFNAADLPSTSSTDADDIVNALDVKSAIYLKTATLMTGGVTYGHQFYEDQNGRLSIGARAKFMEAKVFKSVNSFQKYLKQSANNQNFDLSDDLEGHTDLSTSETNFGIDIGAQWVADNWMAGLTIENLNSPSFKYNELGQTGTNKFTEQFYANQFNLKEEVELKAQGRLEGAYFSADRQWTIAGSYDLNETNDLLGQEHQWASISASFASAATQDEWYYALIPDVRIGYRKNMVGSERSLYTPGLSWGPLNLDLAFENFDDISKLGNIGSETDGDSETPETLQVNLGLEVYF